MTASSAGAAYPNVLRPSGPRMIAHAAPFLAFAIGAVAIIGQGNWTALWGLALFGGGAAYFLALLLPGAGELRIEPAGFTMRRMFRPTFIPWEAVKQFGVKRVAWWTLWPSEFFHQLRVEFQPEAGRRVSRSFDNIYAMNIDDLAALMNRELAAARSRVG
jgi:hypothetical protein